MCLEWDSARCRAGGKALGGVGGMRRRRGGYCEVKSAEAARVKGPRNSAELPLIAQRDAGPLALKHYQSIVTTAATVM